MPLLHLAIAGRGGFTPGGPAFVFGRLVQDGLVQRWLDAHCPEDPAASILCPWREAMPKTANDFLWHVESPFRKIGWWGGADAELGRLNRAVIAAYPLEFVTTALRSTAIQLVTVRTGDGLDEWQEVTRWVFRTYLPQQEPAFTAARQQQEAIRRPLFDMLNAAHVPVAHLSGLGLVLVLVWAVRTGRTDLATLAALVGLALLGNAFISGALSNPHDRYQSRMVWLATAVLAAAWLSARERRR